MAQFGDMLSELRKDKNLTQRQLGDIIFVTNRTISNYEKNNYLPDVDKIIKLADFFDVTVDYLLGRCAKNLSPSVLDEEIVAGCSLASLIADLKCLDQERLQALLLVIRDMKMALLMGQYNKEGRK